MLNRSQFAIPLPRVFFSLLLSDGRNTADYCNSQAGLADMGELDNQLLSTAVMIHVSASALRAH